MSPRCCFSTCVFPCGLPMGLSLPASGHKLTTSFSPIHISSHKAGRNPKLLRLFPKTDKEPVPASLPKRVRPLSLLASDPGGPVLLKPFYAKYSCFAFTHDHLIKTTSD